MVRERRLVLLVEDDPGESYVITRGLAVSGLDILCDVVPSAPEAVTYLERALAGAGGGMPDLVLLDVRLADGSGFEVLEWARREPRLASVRFVMITNYADGETVGRAYELGAHSVIPKSALIPNYSELGPRVAEYWLRVDASNVDAPREEPREDD